MTTEEKRWSAYLGDAENTLNIPEEFLTHDTIPRLTTEDILNAYFNKPVEFNTFLEQLSMRDLHGELKMHIVPRTFWFTSLLNLPSTLRRDIWSFDYWVKLKSFPWSVDSVDHHHSCVGLWHSLEFNLGKHPPSILGAPPTGDEKKSEHANMDAFYASQFKMFSKSAGEYLKKGDTYMRYQCACWHRALLCARILFLRQTLDDEKEVLQCARHYLRVRKEMKNPWRIAPDFYFDPSIEQQLLEDRRLGHHRKTDAHLGTKPIFWRLGKTHLPPTPIAVNDLQTAQKEKRCLEIIK